MKRILPLLGLFLLAAGAFCPVASAERISFKDMKDGENPGASRFWVGLFNSGKSATAAVRLDQIASVCNHSYTIAGNLVREVTIDTTGNNSIRIYCLSASLPSSAQSRLNNTANLVRSKTGDASRVPAKSFPEGAYSHNIEYQVDSEAELDAIYDSVINAVISNKGCVYKVKAK